MTKDQASRRRARIALAVILAIATTAALWYWRVPLLTLFTDRERVQAWIADFGPWGPLVSIALNISQVLLAPIPGQVIGIANGYLYGIGLGTLYSMIGLVAGRVLAMFLARLFGRRLIERLVDTDQLERWDRIVNRQGPMFFFLVFLFPALPDDLVCFLVGLSALSIPRMTVLTALGGLPGVFVSCWVGAYASELPWWAWIPMGAGMAALAWVFWRFQTHLEAAMVTVVHRLTPRRKPQGPAGDS